jgi:hypothetical protein
VEDVATITEMQFDYLLLADGAQVQGGKLYVLGGGWDRVQFPEYPQTLPIGLAFGVRVPWNQTNRPHTFTIQGLSSDADTELFRLQGEFEVGRPPGIPRGMAQLFQAALQIPLHVPGPGQYYIQATIDESKASYRVPYFAVPQ